MTGFNWTSQDSDDAMGAFLHADCCDHETMVCATNTFKELCVALHHDNAERANLIWETMVMELGPEEDPLGLIVCVGVIFNAFIIRSLAGDPDPMGKPTGTTGITVLAMEKDTGRVVDSPLEEFATAAVVHACNWQWGDLNNLMRDKANAGELTPEFLGGLARCLISMFVGVGGVDTAGWCEPA